MIVCSSHVKVGHRQTPYKQIALLVRAFLFRVFGVDLLVQETKVRLFLGKPGELVGK